MNWRSIFFKNYQAKIALLLMAVFLWFFVVSSREYNQILNIPIKLLQLKPDKVFLEKPVSHAQVRFHGKGTSLLLLSLFGDAHFLLDLATINYFYDYPLSLDQLHWASGISVEAVEILRPDTLFIRIDDEIQRTIKVKPMLDVTPAERYTVTGSVEVVPDTVVARGAKSILQDLKFIPTQIRTIDKATGTVNARLDLIPPEMGSVQLEPASVRVSLRIEKIGTLMLSDIPVNIIHCEPDKPGYSEPATVAIRISGPESILNGIDKSAIMISVSAQGSPSEAGLFTPVVHLPDNVELVEMTPDTVRIMYGSVEF